MPALSIFAGPTALRRIKREGINPDQFRVLVGASGGPKWFVLFGLDRYLFGNFFAAREQELITLGSSVGAWRMCCLATSDPVSAIERLAHLYSHETYSESPTVREITASARAMLGKVLGPEGAGEVADNRVFRTHIVAGRCKGPCASHSELLQAAALGLSAAANCLHRKTLSLFFQRTLFHNMGDLSPWKHLKDIDTATAALTAANLFDVMIASGSIPFVLEGVRDIAGARSGLYRDGGITDYHFDMLFHAGRELVLYPHFYPQVIPGWFDKRMSWRRIHEENFHNVVLVTPSDEFVAALPGARIPNRTDFQRLDDETRIRAWQQVLDRSHELADEFSRLVERGVGLDRIRPLSERDR